MKTKIEWATDVWNPVTGCTKVSPGCKNCYAKALHDRRAKAYKAGKKVPRQYGVPFEKPWCHDDRIEYPLHWKAPRHIFVNSMSDLFHETVYEHAESFIDEVFAIMAATPQHTYMVLTKRAALMQHYMTNERRAVYVEHALEGIYGTHGWCSPDFEWPLPNVWLGVSVENQDAADDRIEWLVKTPAAKRFLSCEPLLGPVELFNVSNWNDPGAWWGKKLPLDWVICGGESGPNARPMHPEWARSLRDQCKRAGFAFFFKQWGEWFSSYGVQDSTHLPTFVFPDGYPVTRIGKKEAGRELDGRLWDEFPG